MMIRFLFAIWALLLAACTAEDPTRMDTDVLMTFDSSAPVAETMDRFEALVRAQGLTVFARIDHAANAASAGLELPANQVLIFGNPKAGTQLMQANPDVGLDLPLRALVREKGDGSVLIMQDPASVAVRYRIRTLKPLLAKIRSTLRTLGTDAVKAG
ncbi:MAG: DUF302 domain-containing protein [Pseudomonadota bacterium]